MSDSNIPVGPNAAPAIRDTFEGMVGNMYEEKFGKTAAKMSELVGDLDLKALAGITREAGITGENDKQVAALNNDKMTRPTPGQGHTVV